MNVGLTGGTPNLLYIDGKPDHKLGNDGLVDKIETVVRAELAKRESEETAPARKVIPLTRV